VRQQLVVAGLQRLLLHARLVCCPLLLLPKICCCRRCCCHLQLQRWWQQWLLLLLLVLHALCQGGLHSACGSETADVAVLRAWLVSALCLVTELHAGSGSSRLALQWMQQSIPAHANTCTHPCSPHHVCNNQMPHHLGL
jgi:hypothetical protein